MGLGGKRILICHTIVLNIMGSTVVTLELAEYFKAHGADVTVYASYLGEPMLGEFAMRGICVIDDGTPVVPSDFDLVWVNSQVLPLSFCDVLHETAPIQLPTFIFLHMSALDIAPDEHPYIPGLEEHLSSLSLFVSQSTLEHLRDHYDKLPSVALFENPAPQRFATLPAHTTRRHQRRILVVSNHPPREVHHAGDILRRNGHVVTFMGASEDRYELLSPRHLGAADAVVTIGKTVQYCLVAGTPVYVYDHFGGPGFLTSDTFEGSAQRNHCGAGYERKSAHQIATEITTGLDEALKFHREHLQQLRQRYLLDNVMAKLLDSLNPKPIASLEKHLVQALCSAQRFANRYYRHWGQFDELILERDQLKRQVEQIRLEHELALADARALRHSWSFRLGQVATRPVFAAWKVVSTRIRRASSDS